MILEDQLRNNTFIKQSSSLQQIYYQNEGINHESQTSRLRSDYHNKIRIRELDKIRAQKRRVIQINLTIQQILKSDFPKQSDEAKHWAHNLVQLFDTSKKYQTDVHKLRQIFLLAQRFPNLGTLRLFYLALINSNTDSVRALYDVDVWRFLHNILQFPNLNSRSNKNINEETSCSPSSKNLNTLFVQIQMIKAAIETFVCLFKKDKGFRDYSIGIHQSYSNYLKPAYRKYGESIKLEVLYFIKQVFAAEPKSYSREYVSLIKLTLRMFIEYKEMFTSFFDKKQWNEVQTKETVEEAIKRAGIVIAILHKLFSYIDKKWVYDFLQGEQLSKDFNYLNIVHSYLQFGSCVLNKLLTNNEDISNHAQFFQSTIDFMHNTFTFYMVYVDKNIQDGPQSFSVVPDILKKTVQILQLLKSCQQNKVFNQIKKQMLLDIQKTKEACLFALDFSLCSQFDTYDSYFKNFIFFEGKNGKQINLLNLLEYFLNKSHHSNIISQLVSVIFSLLRMKVPQGEVHKFFVLRQMIEKICEILADDVILQNTKQKICSQFLGYLEMDCKSLGSNLKIQDIFINNLNKITEFMYSEFCSENSYKAIDKVIKVMRSNHQQF